MDSGGLHLPYALASHHAPPPTHTIDSDRQASLAASLRASQAAHDAEVTELRAAVEARQRAVEALEAKMAGYGSLDRLNAVLTAEQERLLGEVASLNARLNATKGQSAEYAAAMERQHRTIITLEAQVEAARGDARVSDGILKARISKLEQMLATAKSIMEHQSRELYAATRSTSPPASPASPTSPPTAAPENPNPAAEAELAHPSLALAHLEAQCAHLSHELESIAARASRAEAERDAAQFQISKLSSTLQSHLESIIGLQTENARLRADLTSAPTIHPPVGSETSPPSSNTSQQELLKARVASLNSQLLQTSQDHEKEVNDLNSQISQLETQVQLKTKALAELSSALRRKDMDLASKDKKLEKTLQALNQTQSRTAKVSNSEELAWLKTALADRNRELAAAKAALAEASGLGPRSPPPKLQVVSDSQSRMERSESQSDSGDSSSADTVVSHDRDDRAERDDASSSRSASDSDSSGSGVITAVTREDDSEDHSSTTAAYDSSTYNSMARPSMALVAELEEERDRLKSELAATEARYENLSSRTVALEGKFKSKLQEVMQMTANQIAYAKELESEIELIEEVNAELQTALDETKQALLESNLKIKTIQGNIHESSSAPDLSGASSREPLRPAYSPSTGSMMTRPRRPLPPAPRSPRSSVSPHSPTTPTTPTTPSRRGPDPAALSVPHKQLVAIRKSQREPPVEDESVFGILVSETGSENCAGCGTPLEAFHTLVFDDDVYHDRCAPACAHCGDSLSGESKAASREDQARAIQAEITADRRTLSGLVSLEELYLEGSVERAAVEEQIAKLEAKVRAATRDMHELFFYRPPFIRVDTDEGPLRIHFDCLRDQSNDALSPTSSVFPEIHIRTDLHPEGSPPPELSAVRILPVTRLNGSSSNLLLSPRPAGDGGDASPSGQGGTALIARIKIEVVSARNLSQNSRKKPNVYCQIKHGRIKRKTKVVRKTLSPIWREAFVLTLDEALPTIELSVLGKEKIRDSFLGRVIIDVSKYSDGELHDETFVLQRKSSKNRVSGDLRLRLRITLDSSSLITASPSSPTLA